MKKDVAGRRLVLGFLALGFCVPSLRQTGGSQFPGQKIFHYL